jgi:hypothetical protein
VALRGVLAAVAKAIIQLYFVNFLPLPYWLMRRLPGRTPRRYGGSGNAAVTEQLARSGGRGLTRDRTSFGRLIDGQDETDARDGAALAAVPAAPNAGVQPVDAEPAAALVAALVAAFAVGLTAGRALVGAGLRPA